MATTIASLEQLSGWAVLALRLGTLAFIQQCVRKLAKNTRAPDVIVRLRALTEALAHMPLEPGQDTRRTTMRFEVYRDKAGEYRWRLLSSNGRLTANSGEATRAARTRTARSPRCWPRSATW